MNHFYDEAARQTRCGEHEGEAALHVSANSRVSCPDCRRLLTADELSDQWHPLDPADLTVPSFSRVSHFDFSDDGPVNVPRRGAASEGEVRHRFATGIESLRYMQQRYGVEPHRRVRTRRWWIFWWALLAFEVLQVAAAVTILMMR